MVSVGHRENIRLLTYSEVVECSGYIGNFKVKVRRKPRYVDEDKCTGCGQCWSVCPATRIPKKRTIRLGSQIIKQVQ
jgi:heterodisulfide reductase subunit A